MARVERKLMETIEKKIVWIDCESCGGHFDQDGVHHYENPFTHWEADLCDPCADHMAAKHYSVDD